MPNHIDCLDPRGIRVVCTESTWHQKILATHADLAGCEHLVRLTIERPRLNLVFQDAHNPSRNAYYGLFEGSPFYVKVVVELGEDGRSARIVTAYRTSNRKSTEVPIWPR